MRQGVSHGMGQVEFVMILCLGADEAPLENDKNGYQLVMTHGAAALHLYCSSSNSPGLPSHPQILH